jgi:hypothetical protein
MDYQTTTKFKILSIYKWGNLLICEVLLPSHSNPETGNEHDGYNSFDLGKVIDIIAG